MSLLNKIFVYIFNFICCMLLILILLDIDENIIINIEYKVVVGKIFSCEWFFYYLSGMLVDLFKNYFIFD